MSRNKWLPLILFTAIVLALLVYYPSAASDENRAALVVDFGNGQVATRCVGFSEETINGFELLQRAGLPVETDFQTGGAAVCRIDGQGCPSDDCFCSCRGGGDCLYWSYWHQTDGVWGYSAAGSALYQVADGAVEGWVWGLGSVTQAVPPPPVTFGDVCAADETPTVTATPTRTATPIVLPTQAPTVNSLQATSTATPPLGSSPQPTATVTGTITPAVTTVAITNTTPTTPPTPRATPGGAAVPLPSPANPTGQTVATGQAVTGANDPAVAAPANVAPPATPMMEPIAGTAAPIPGADSAASIGAAAAPETGFVEPAMNQAAAPPVADQPVPSPTAVVAAVVGESAANEAVPAPSIPPAAATAAPQRLAYAGFFGLVLLLSALALAVYRRRLAARQSVRR